MQENLEQFKENLIKSSLNLSEKELQAGSSTLGEIDIKEIDFELLEILEEFEPYGQKNPRPSFILKNVQVKVDKVIGKERNHLKLILQKENLSIESLFFNYDVDVKRGDIIDIQFSVSRNDYRGLVTPQLLIKQILSYK